MSRKVTKKTVQRVETEEQVFGRSYDATVERVEYQYPDSSTRESYDVCWKCWGKHIRPLFKTPPNTMDT